MWLQICGNEVYNGRGRLGCKEKRGKHPKRRLISARIADKEERRIYYAGGNKKGSDWRPANA